MPSTRNNPSAATISAVQRRAASIRWRRWRLDEVTRRITDIIERGEMDEAARKRLAALLAPPAVHHDRPAGAA